MKWNTEYFGFRLLVFMGFCGEVPVALLRKTGGCYDYRRRVVTELVRTGYLKERKFRGERRRVVRSLSLTSRGLNQIQHLSPGRAEQIRARLLAPADGQGDWRRTQRLPRNAACLLLALTNQVLSALGKPVLPIESQTVEQLVTAGITTVAALVAWWKNNSFTPAALQADQTYDKLKAQGK